jgi:hypothetical protein
MATVKFKQGWLSPLDQQSTWDLIVQAFQDSRNSTIWPNEYAEIHADGQVKQGSTIFEDYKLGRIKLQADYHIVLFLPPNYLKYQADKRHPLIGGAEIVLSPRGQQSYCEWKGAYQSKNPLGWPTLIWFKAYYERMFFKKLVQNFARLESRRASAA